MNWEASWMDIGLATVAAALIVNVFTDILGWKKVKNKIGVNKSDTLEVQHDNIEKTIISKTESLEKLQSKEFMHIRGIQNNIGAKADKINEIVNRNEGRYENLNLDQREIKNNLDKLLFEWQNLSMENKELKKEIENLKDQNYDLIYQNDELFQKNDEVQENNKKLSKKLKIAMQTLDTTGKLKRYSQNLENEKEDDEWELER